MFINSEIFPFVTKRDKDFLLRVTEALSRVSRHSKILGKIEIGGCCHSITRALAFTFAELTVIDGYCVGFKKENDTTVELKYTTHSWLITPDGAIIEAYPVSFISPCPVLVPTKGPRADACSGYYLTNQLISNAVRKKICTRKMFRESSVIAELMK